MFFFSDTFFLLLFDLCYNIYKAIIVKANLVNLQKETMKSINF